MYYHFKLMWYTWYHLPPIFLFFRSYSSCNFEITFYFQDVNLKIVHVVSGWVRLYSLVLLISKMILLS